MSTSLSIDPVRSRMRYCVLALCCGLSLPAFAETDAPPVILPQGMDTVRDSLSQGVVSFARWVDGFFGREEGFEERRDNYIQFNVRDIMIRNEEPGYRSEFRAHISLPRTENRLKLVVESTSAPQSTAEEDGTAPTLESALEDREQSVALRLIPVDEPLWQLRGDAGVHFNNGIDTFVRARARRRVQWDIWQLNASETLFWFDSTGWGETTRVDFERALGTDNLFRATSEATWTKDTDYFDAHQDFSVFHTISSRRVVIYEASAHGISEPSPHTTAYTVGIRLRQRVHRDWLYFEVWPHVDYLEESNFAPRPSLILTLEMLFGEKR